MGKWDADSPNFNYKERGYTVHTNVNVGLIRNGVVCTKKGAIALSLIDGTLKYFIAADFPLAHKFCKKAKKMYEEDTNQTFSVSSKAMVMETLIHAYPQLIADILGDSTIMNILENLLGNTISSKLEELQSYLDLHCRYADIGEADTLRYFDPLLIGLYHAILWGRLDIAGLLL